MTDTPPTSEPYRFRSSARVHIRQEAELVAADGRSTRVLVVDISSQGFRLLVDEPVERGAALKLRVPRKEELAVEIKWRRGREAGGIFLESVPELR